MRNQRSLSALDEAAATPFDHAEESGVTVQEATTAAQEAVCRAVTAESSAATIAPADDRESSTSMDQVLEVENQPEEAPPADVHDPDALSEEVQSAEAPTEEEEEIEESIDAQDSLDYPHLVEMMREDLNH